MKNSNMKKKVLILLLLSFCLYLFSCSSEIPIKTDIKDGISYEIIIIDSFEYILGTDSYPYNGGYFLSHKGNCKNPIHYKTKVAVVDTVEYQLIRK